MAISQSNVWPDFLRENKVKVKLEGFFAWLKKTRTTCGIWTFCFGREKKLSFEIEIWKIVFRLSYYQKKASGREWEGERERKRVREKLSTFEEEGKQNFLLLVTLNFIVIILCNFSHTCVLTLFPHISAMKLHAAAKSNFAIWILIQDWCDLNLSLFFCLRTHKRSWKGWKGWTRKNED